MCSERDVSEAVGCTSCYSSKHEEKKYPFFVTFFLDGLYDFCNNKFRKWERKTASW
jgi:hypothetical protein